MNGAFVYAAAGGAVFGIALGLLVSIPVGAVVVLAAAGLVVAAAGKGHTALVGAALISAVALGLLRADIFLTAERAQTLASHIGRPAVITGTVAADPDRRDASVRVTVEARAADGQPTRGTLIAVLPRATVLYYGDTVVLKGTLNAPQPFAGSNGNVFDYPSYLRAQGVSALLERANVVSFSSGGWSVQKTLFSAKHWFEHSIEKIFPKPDAALLEGILLGEKHGIPQNLSQAFIASGLVHIVVLSGSNVSVISEGLFRAISLAPFIPPAGGMGLGGVGIILFVLMTGSGATAVRAAAMGLIAILARYFHRPAAALRALVFVTAAMALWNPPSVLFDPSFILSVLASFGLITLSPFVESKLPAFLSRARNLRSIVASTLSVQIFLLPALLYFTGVFSLFALPANAVVLPAVPATMGLGFAGGILNALGYWFAFIPAAACDLLLRFTMLVATAVQSLPFSSAVLTLPAWLAVLIYVPLTALAVALYRRSAVRKHSSSHF